jgi:hypothetical protein
MVNMKTWFSKQRWHFIYGLVILCLLAGTTWQRWTIETQKKDLKVLSQYIVKEHMAAVEHMYRVHGVAPQQRRF